MEGGFGSVKEHLIFQTVSVAEELVLRSSMPCLVWASS